MSAGNRLSRAAAPPEQRVTLYWGPVLQVGGGEPLTYFACRYSPPADSGKAGGLPKYVLPGGRVVDRRAVERIAKRMGCTVRERRG